MSSIQGATGYVKKDGSIVSNANFTCQHDDKGPYNVGYGSAGLNNPVPVVSLTVSNSSKSYTLERSADGFSLQVWKESGGERQEANGAFDFIVAEMI